MDGVLLVGHKKGSMECVVNLPCLEEVKLICSSLLSQLKMSSHVHFSVPLMVSYTHIILGHHLIAVFDYVKSF